MQCPETREKIADSAIRTLISGMPNEESSMLHDLHHAYCNADHPDKETICPLCKPNDIFFIPDFPTFQNKNLFIFLISSLRQPHSLPYSQLISSKNLLST